MTILKASGRVAEQKNDRSARIEILAFKRNGENITSPVEIKQQFPPHGYVFAPAFFDKFEYALDSLVEITTSALPSQKGGGADVVIMDINKGCKNTGFPVFHLSKEIFINEGSINQPYLKNVIRGELTHFYIRNNGFYYGPFKTSNNEVIPQRGATVNKYLYSFGEYKCGAKFYILFEPTEIVTIIDCMTPLQLVTFLKDQIRNLQINIDIPLLRKAIEAQVVEELEKAKLKRLFATLERFELSKQDFKDLAIVSDKFYKCYKEALEKANEELKEEFIEPLSLLKGQLEGELKSLRLQLQQLTQEKNACQSSLDAASKEFHTISREKERLIQDIRVHSLIHQPVSIKQEKLATYEEQSFLQIGTPFSTLVEFIKLFNSTIQTQENGSGRFGFNAVYQLKDFKCLLSENVHTILQMAKLSNNCRVFIQQVEPDWLKFESFYDNGLRQIWESALNCPDSIHFLILEDLNMASIECYGKPVLDLLSGVRTKLPGVNTSWPRNFWIFGIPLVQAEGYNFGLPLIKNTFRHWGFFPKVAPMEVSKQAESAKLLRVETLYEHEELVPIPSQDYFPEL